MYQKFLVYGIMAMSFFLLGLYAGTKISKPMCVSAIPYAPAVKTVTKTNTVVRTVQTPGGCETVITAGNEQSLSVPPPTPETVTQRDKTHPKASIGMSYRPRLHGDDLYWPEEIGISASASIAGSPVHVEVGGNYNTSERMIKPEVGFRYIK